MAWVILATTASMAFAGTAAALSATASTSTSKRCPSLGGRALRDIVADAARADASESLDLRGIAWLEHINLVVGSEGKAEAFYEDFLGLSRDRDAKFHVNLGQQQFHLAATGDPAQVVAGSVGLAVPDLDAVRGRVAAAADALEGTMFAVEDDSEGKCLTVTCPWGNRMHLYSVVDDNDAEAVSDSSQKMVKNHAEGGTYSPHRMSVRGKPGIRFVELPCRPGRVPALRRFYEEIIGCCTSTREPGKLAVSVGPGVHLIFFENEEYSDADDQAMEGVHICVYVHDFSGLYRRLSERNLIWTNPRFTHLDSCDTWEEAVASRTLRFKDVVDPKTGEKMFELEHETRPLRHGQYLKVPCYVPK